MAAVMDGALRAGPLVAVPEVLRELGQDLAAVLTEAGLAPGFLDDPENNVGFDVVGRLLELCVARTGCAHFGLRLGQKGGLDSLGLVGLLGAHSLNRRLRGCGITFRELLGEVRRAWAQQLLRDSDVPVVSIAAALGYTDPAAFTRAFRRWCQTTMIPGNQLPPPAPPFGGVIKKNAIDSSPGGRRVWCRPRVPPMSC